MLTMDIATETLRFVEPFRISGHVFNGADVLLVTLSDGFHRGRGEASGVYFLGDDLPYMREALENARSDIERGPDREALRALMPAGGARNAVDAALWDLEAQRTGRPVWALAGVPEPRAIRTTFTLGADTPDAMARAATRRLAHARSIKIKLTGELSLDIDRVASIRAARPDVWLGVDANQGFAHIDLGALATAMASSGVSLIEQPLPRGDEAQLEDFRSPVPIAGDESLCTLADLATAAGRFDVVNIKLDKCGGLTEGLLMAAEARRLGLGVMVGTMIGTSLATAPGFVLGQVCDLVDLDGPTFLAMDRQPSVVYRDGDLFVGPEVWGAAGTVAA